MMSLLAEEFGLMRVMYFELNDDQDIWEIIARYEKDVTPHPNRGRISDFSVLMAAEYRLGRTLVINDTRNEPQYEGLRAIEVGAAMAVPLVKNGKLVAVVVVHSKTARHWNKAEVQIVESFAERTWDAVERARAEYALRESEKRFQSIANLVPDLLWDSEPDGSTNWYNQRWLEYTGQSLEQAIGWGWLDTIHPDDREGSGKQYGEAVNAGQPLHQEHRIRRHDGQYRWFVVSALPLKDTNGHVIKMYGAAIDIHDRRQGEEALRLNEERMRELNTRLQQTDIARTAFFNNVSHEFRTPLTLIVGPLEELMRSGVSKLDPADMKMLQFMHRNALRLQKLVTTLLDFSRIEAGKLEAHYQPVDFSKVTTDLASTFRTAIEKGGLKFVIQVEQISQPVYLDHDMWEKIVFNLLSNALKFTLKGKIEVVIREKSKHVELKVVDTGVGIAEKNIDRVFNRFTRIEGVQARTDEGTGIGLALVRELVTALGGVIKLKSAEGVGSEFIVSIPKGTKHFANHQIIGHRQQQEVTNLKNSFADETAGWLPDDIKASAINLRKYEAEGGFRILVAEDNADMREYLSNVLSEDDHRIFAVEDGKKVITFLEGGGQADLILSDVMMPVMDGFELVKTLKANPKFAPIPVILLTAKMSEESKAEGLRIGAEAYLTKPFSAKELRAIVILTMQQINKVQ